MLSFINCDDILLHFDRVTAALGPGWTVIPEDKTACHIAYVTKRKTGADSAVDARRKPGAVGVTIASICRVEYDAALNAWSFTNNGADNSGSNYDSSTTTTGIPGCLTLDKLLTLTKGFGDGETNGKNSEESVSSIHENGTFSVSKNQSDADALLCNRDDDHKSKTRSKTNQSNLPPPPHLTHFETKLSNADIQRYSRQLILPEIGVSGQTALKSGSVLVVGAGGLGCPAGVFLAAAGVGRIGIVDYDQVEISNLHRQIAHSEDKIDVAKAESLSQACRRLNSSCKTEAIQAQISSANAMELISGYDVILDCTDNVASRYLLNDACVLNNKPLVSGSALRWEGQLTVYNHASGPCYRCIFPNPPPPETVTNCSDGGVIGVVPGIIGSLQALEAIKLLCQAGSTCSQRLLLFDGLDNSFRKIKLRNRKEDCRVCGLQPDIRHLIDYELFCGSAATDKDFSLSLLSSSDRVSVSDYHKILVNEDPHLLIDVRTGVETDICRLPTSASTIWWNLPIEELKRRTSGDEMKEALLKEFANDKLAALKSSSSSSSLSSSSSSSLPSSPNVFVACRRGNDSQIAVDLLRNLLKLVVKPPNVGDSLNFDVGSGGDGTTLESTSIRDIAGGLHAWAKRIDNNFPVY